MRTFLLGVLLAIAFIISYSGVSFAVCTEGPPNNWTCNTAQPNPDPSGIQIPNGDPGVTATMLPASAIDTVPANGGNSGTGMDTTNNNDEITLTGASINTNASGIRSNNGMDIINVTDSVITSISDCIDKGFVGGSVMNITGSTLLSTNNDVIEGGGDNDVIFISHSTLTTQGENANSEAIDLNSGNDELTLGTGVVLNSNFEGIDCGEGDDTIIFAMQVPTNQVDAITAEINSKDPSGDSIIINNLLYDWVDCEELIADLSGGFSTPVPTLSQWGLIVTAGLFGIIGFIVIRRRQLKTNS